MLKPRYLLLAAACASAFAVQTSAATSAIASQELETSAIEQGLPSPRLECPAAWVLSSPLCVLQDCLGGAECVCSETGCSLIVSRLQDWILLVV